jgi:2-polyprenyl-3-methyl-5-hydroxy-6-metoxy-1,4-benzoquinol methylase
LGTNYSLTDLKDPWVLDMDCGAGSFTEVALNAGAPFESLDYSSAVVTCCTNLKLHQNLHTVWEDIFTLPFARGVFQFVFSLGVLQHRPDVAKFFRHCHRWSWNGAIVYGLLLKTNTSHAAHQVFFKALH